MIMIIIVVVFFIVIDIAFVRAMDVIDNCSLDETNPKNSCKTLNHNNNKAKQQPPNYKATIQQDNTPLHESSIALWNLWCPSSSSSGKNSDPEDFLTGNVEWQVQSRWVPSIHPPTSPSAPIFHIRSTFPAS